MDGALQKALVLIDRLLLEKGGISVNCTEAYKEHIEYTFNAFCRVVIHYAAINAWRDRDKRRQREISFEYLTEEKAVEKAIAALADMIPLEAMQPPHSPALTFPGLEIKLHQRRVLKNGTDIPLTRLEYGALCYLAASPGRVFTKAQIFEAVWSMESESCQSNVANVICNLRKKIEPDNRKPTYIKTVIGVSYKFVSRE